MDLPTFLAVGIAAGVVAFKWGYPAVIATCFLIVLAVRSYRACLVATPDGLTVKNQYRSYRIPWSDVRGIVAEIPRGLDGFDWNGRRLSLDRRSRRSRLVAFVSVGMTSAEQISTTLEIAACARSFGYEIPAGTRDEVRRVYAGEAATQNER